MINRRLFTSSLLAAGVALPTIHHANASLPYIPLAKNLPVNSNGKVEVIEFFWYNCIHCYHSYPAIAKWAKTNADKIDFKMIPVQFRPSFEQQQRLFYALEQMNAIDNFHYKVFQAIFEEHKKLDAQSDIYRWIEQETTLDIKIFMGHFESMAIAQKAKRAKDLQDAYSVQATPSFGVAGKYYVDGQIAQPKTLLEVVGELVTANQVGK